MKVKSGQLDYYIGACNTGAGAALSIAIAVIGYNKSCTIAKPGILLYIIWHKVTLCCHFDTSGS